MPLWAAAAASAAGLALAAGAAGWGAAAVGVPALALGWALAAWRGRPETSSPDAALVAALSADTVVLRFEANGEVGDASRAARDVLGLAPELLLGQGLFERVHVADRVAYLCAMGDLRGGAARRSVAVRLRLPGAERDSFGGFRLELTADPDGRWAATGLLRADGERRRLEDERDAALAQANASAKTQSRLLAALGHELRTPLNAVIGFSEMLLSERLGGCTDPRQLEYAGLIRASGAHLLRVADGMLEAGSVASGARALELETLDLGEAGAACRAMLALPAAERGVRVVSRIGAGETVLADRRVVQQVLVNLLSNAVKFSPSGGVVTLEATRNGSSFTLRVSDTGAGMSEAACRQAGGSFGRKASASTGEGAGIGLNLVQRLLAAHGGRLTLDSGVGAGTVASATFGAGAASDASWRGEAALAFATGDKQGRRDGAVRKTA